MIILKRRQHDLACYAALILPQDIVPTLAEQETVVLGVLPLIITYPYIPEASSKHHPEAGHGLTRRFPNEAGGQAQ